MKQPESMTFEELVDWAAGYILGGLIAGKFKESVWMVCNHTSRWKDAQKKPK